MFNRSLWLRFVFLIFLFSSLLGCGGGGGNNSSDQQQTGGTETNPATLTVGTPTAETIGGTLNPPRLSYFTFKTGPSTGSYGISITGAHSDLGWDLFEDPEYSASFVAGCDKLIVAGNEICTTTLSANTTYYLRVSNWDSTTTTYTLTVTFLDPDAGCGSGTCFNFESGSIPVSFVPSGDAPWLIDSANAAAGIYSVVSGTITHNQTSCFEYSAANAEAILFSVKTDSELDIDKLKFFIDNTLQSLSWSGTTSWTRVIFGTTSGTHTYKWCYAKDGSISSGTDRVWVDDIEIK